MPPQTSPSSQGGGSHFLANSHVGWLAALPRIVLRAQTHFSCYLHFALLPDSRGDSPEATALWPCPPPFSWDEPETPWSFRAAARARRRHSQDVLTNILVLAMSFVAGGRVRFCIPAGRSGRPLTFRQMCFARRIRRLVAVWCRRVTSTERCAVKMSSLLASVEAVATGQGGDCGVAPLRFRADRCRFAKAPGSFDPTRFLDVFEGLCYDQPRLLDRTDLRTAAPVPAIPQRGARGRFSVF